MCHYKASLTECICSEIRLLQEFMYKVTQNVWKINNAELNTAGRMHIQITKIID